MTTSHNHGKSKHKQRN